MERITYRSADSRLNEQILSLLCEAFGTQYHDYYLMQLAHLPSAQHTKLIADSRGYLVAHTQVVDYYARLEGGEEPLKVAYLFAVCTAKAYQGQGIMSRFMTQLLGELPREGYSAAYLIPAEIWLSDYYRRFGFKLMRGEIYSKAPKHAVPLLSPGHMALAYLADVERYERVTQAGGEDKAPPRDEWEIMLPRQIGWMCYGFEGEPSLPDDTPLLLPLT